jgi:uncharacterized membrane protein YqhA
MNLKSISDRDLIWYVAIHLVFVGSGVLMAWTDRIAGEHGKYGGKQGGKAS